MGDPQEFLDSPALDGTPAQAYASHRVRANGIAEYFAATRPLSEVSGQAGENETIALIAHLHVAARDPANSQQAIAEVREALHRLHQGPPDNPDGLGLVGTDLKPLLKRDYDMALKGLMPILYRYRSMLRDEDFDFILDKLVPGYLRGAHPPSIEIAFSVPFTVPETENHLLMIESSRYLVNQLLHDRHPDDKEFDNVDRGLSKYLLTFLQTIAEHDFLEFSARAYARLSLHALLNLHEFAREERIRTAAQIVLDYTMMKFAVSGLRGRRVTPFRRQQHRINHQANVTNDLYAERGDQVAGFFLAYTGLTNARDEPARFPASLAFQAVIAATAAYRPPPAAYSLALDHSAPPATHRFQHGRRPRLTGADEDADPGIEIYSRSPSYLLSAGGSFLNSGYGHDQVDVFAQAFEQTSRAQATTLIPTRADTRFHDLLRFEPYPDPAVDPYADDPDDPDTLHSRAVALGVHRDIIAGANLRPAERKIVLEQSTSEAPALTSNDGQLLVAWKGSGNDNLNVAKVLTTGIFDIDGVEGVEAKTVLSETTDLAPAIASHDGRVVLAWRGSGNSALNLACSGDGGQTFGPATTLSESSDHPPALAFSGSRLVLAWTGRGNEHLNLARVVLFANTAGRCGIEGIDSKIVLGETSSDSPALASNLGRLFLAWKGSGNDNLNIAVSEDDGMTFPSKTTLPETSSDRPALAAHAGKLFLAWKGSGNDQLNAAHAVLLGNTEGFAGFVLEDKVVLPEASDGPPALVSNGELLLIAWQDQEDEHLGLRISRDGAFGTVGPH